MPAIVLPDVPDQPVLVEDFVAALFQSAGYFVEQNVVETDKDSSDGHKLLEMDVVATRYDGPNCRTVIAEAKSGDVGVKDLFKLLGWLSYLRTADTGAFFSMRPFEGRTEASVNKRFNPYRIHCIELGDCTNAAEKFSTCGLGQVASPGIVEHWRWVYVAIRKLLAHVKQSISESTAPVGARLAIDYHKLVNNEIFFEPSLVARLGRLYEAFSAHPRLCRSVANELATGEFVDEDPRGEQLWRKALFDGEQPLLQACFYFEHRARLAILKCATECHREGYTRPPPLVAHTVPPSFWRGYAALADDPYFDRYALFWQVFLWGFGGFVMMDRRDEEFAHLSHFTGIPVSDIERALTAYDRLFSSQRGSWLYSHAARATRVVKTFPAPLRGLGVHLRRTLYGCEKLSDFALPDATQRDFAIWLRSAISLLSSSPGPKLRTE